MDNTTSEKDFSNSPNGIGNEASHLEQAKANVGTDVAMSSDLREFLERHHGRVDLSPLPSMSLEDPLNWPKWKKNAWLFLVAFHAMFALFMFAGLIPGYQQFAADYNVSLTQASYLTSIQILFSGVFPLLWNPIASRIGRRPVFMISTLGACVCNIGGARATSYGTQVTTRVLNAIFICPPLAIGSGVVAETFFSHERASKMGVWTLMITLSTAIGPFLLGFLFERQPVSWVFWLFAIVNFCQFLAYFFLNAESLYHRPANRTQPVEPSEVRKQKLWSVHKINPAPISFRDFTRPFTAGKFFSIVIPACAYAIVFGFANVGITVEMPQVMGEKFHLSAQGTGLQFISIIIGNVLGEQLSTHTSDWFVRFMNKRHYARKGDDQPSSDASSAETSVENPIARTQTIGGTANIDPTPRLYLAYIGFITTMVGLIVWGVESQRAAPGHWTVTPLVGCAIAAFGNQLVTTTLVTFAVDCHRNLSAEIGVLVNFIRQVWGFIGPFYFPDMFTALGFGGSGGLMAGLVGVVAGGSIIVLHILEHRKFARI